MEPTFSKIDEVLRFLKDGKWHDLEEITQRTGLHEFKADLIVDFLVKYNFAELDERHEKIRAASPLAYFLKEIEALESKADTSE